MQVKTIAIKTEIAFPEFGAKKVTAKIDTGAYSGCFHATNIKVTRTKGAGTLEFSPFDHPDMRYKTIHFTTKRVKSSNGQIEERFFVDTDIIIDGQAYPIRLGLSDRSSMRWPVLIGRKFLKQHKFLVDVSA